MTYEKIQKALRELDAEIMSHHDIADHRDYNPVPTRASSEEGMPMLDPPIDPDYHLGHVRWMIAEALSFPREKKEKGMRWLGFIQGVMWMCGWSIDEMKHANMPDEEKQSEPDVWPGDSPDV